MSGKKALSISLGLHLVLFIVVSANIGWNFTRKKKKEVFIQASLVTKKSEKKNENLPRKKEKKKSNLTQKKVEEPKKQVVKKTPPKKPEKKVEKIAKVKEEKNQLPQAQTAKKAKQVAEKKAKKASAAPKRDSEKFFKELAQLSEQFSEELKGDQQVGEAPEEVSNDQDYFQRIHGLIKEAFIVPSHVNGPKGQELMATIRLFLDQQGDLARVILEKNSGDDHFDQAVVNGAKRVNNFGNVPLILQNLVQERGIVVELCPFKCQKK